MRLALAACTLAMAGCVSFPIPPSDMGGAKRGELGTLTLRVVAEYKPNIAGTMQAAMRKFAPTDGKEVIK